MSENQRPKPTYIPAASDAQSQTPNIVYADGLTALGIGPFTSRLAFGQEHILDNGALTVIPSFTLVMPTKALYQMAKKVIDSIEDSSTNAALDKTINQAIREE